MNIKLSFVDNILIFLRLTAKNEVIISNEDPVEKFGNKNWGEGLK